MTSQPNHSDKFEDFLSDYDLVHSNHKIMGGEPVIRGTRVLASQLREAHQQALKAAEVNARIDECHRLSKASGGGSWRRNLEIRLAELNQRGAE